MKLKYTFILALLILPFTFISCASSMKASESYHNGYATQAEYPAPASRGYYPEESVGKSYDKGYEAEKTVNGNASTPKEAAGDEEDSKQKIIYTAYINLGVYDPDAIKKKIIEALRNLGGFVEQETNMNLILRIPVEAFNQMVEEIIKYGRVITKNISAFDVTEEFYDLVARLKVKKEALGVLQELLKTTESKQLQLEILREIRVLQEEIERAEARLKYLQDKVAFSTITLQLTLEMQISRAPSHVKIPVSWLNWHSLESLID